MIRKSSTSGDDFNGTSFGEESKSTHRLGRRGTNQG